MNVTTFTGDSGNLDYQYVSIRMWPASAAIIIVIALASWYFWERAKVNVARTFADDAIHEAQSTNESAAEHISQGRNGKGVEAANQSSRGSVAESQEKSRGFLRHVNRSTPSALEAQLNR